VYVGYCTGTPSTTTANDGSNSGDVSPTGTLVGKETSFMPSKTSSFKLNAAVPEFVPGAKTALSNLNSAVDFVYPVIDHYVQVTDGGYRFPMVLSTVAYHVSEAFEHPVAANVVDTSSDTFKHPVVVNGACTAIAADSLEHKELNVTTIAELIDDAPDKPILHTMHGRSQSLCIPVQEEDDDIPVSFPRKDSGFASTFERKHSIAGSISSVVSDSSSSSASARKEIGITGKISGAIHRRANSKGSQPLVDDSLHPVLADVDFSRPPVVRLPSVPGKAPASLPVKPAVRAVAPAAVKTVTVAAPAKVAREHGGGRKTLGKKPWKSLTDLDSAVVSCGRLLKGGNRGGAAAREGRFTPIKVASLFAPPAVRRGGGAPLRAGLLPRRLGPPPAFPRGGPPPPMVFPPGGAHPYYPGGIPAQYTRFGMPAGHLYGAPAPQVVYNHVVHHHNYGPVYTGPLPPPPMRGPRGEPVWVYRGDGGMGRGMGGGM
jgi:hypothetical protein